MAESVPQACYDGYNFLKSGDYKKSVNKLTRCLEANSLDAEIKATAYYNRASAYYLQSLAEEDWEKADNINEKALNDVEKSIELDPGYAKAYCLRGWIYLDLSWGEFGDEDIDTGMKLGATKEECSYTYTE